jgi:hypothetical protein
MLRSEVGVFLNTVYSIGDNKSLSSKLCLPKVKMVNKPNVDILAFPDLQTMYIVLNTPVWYLHFSDVSHPRPLAPQPTITSHL